jgi:hypothetical protein
VDRGPSSCPAGRPEVPLADERPRSRTARTPWLRLLILVGLCVLVSTFWHHWLLWPLKMTVVLFHELGHAVAAWVTGGSVVEIHLSPREGGHALTRGGSRFLILNAGYLGSLLAGVGLLAAGRRGLVARGVGLALAASLLVVAVLFVPWLTFAQLFVGLSAVAFGVAAGLLPGFALRWVMRGLGVFSILYAFMDIWSDVFARAMDVTVTSDAEALAALTGIPALVWGGVWIAAGLGLLVLLRRWLV